jgi:hypothetical protein
MSESQLEVYQQCGEITEGINDSLQKLSSNLSALTQTFDRTSTLLDSWIGLCGNAPQHAVPPPAPKPEVQRQAAPEFMPSPVKARQVPCCCTCFSCADRASCSAAPRRGGSAQLL